MGLRYHRPKAQAPWKLSFWTFSTANGEVVYCRKKTLNDGQARRVNQQSQLYPWSYRPSIRADASPTQTASGLESYDDCQAALYSPPQPCRAHYHAHRATR